MMKKMTSMFLALTLCLTLSVPAFAAEEEPELTAEPAVQTEAETVAQEEVAAPAEVETEPAGESVARDICLHKSRRTDYYDVVDRNNYDTSSHVVNHMKHETCLICLEDLGASPDGFSTESHSMRVSVYGTATGDNGETITTYLHACALCNYNYISTQKLP